jgi:radical SAM protein with 4Fe4S-binding SPASM domain
MGGAETPPSSGGARHPADASCRRALAVVARPLVSGRVKTRLATRVGADRALRAYARLLAGTLASAEALGPGHRLVLALTAAQPDVFSRLRALDGSRGWRRDPWELTVQRGRNLGERLAALFDDLPADGARQVVIVNSDSPGLPTEFLAEAFRRMSGGDGDSEGVSGLVDEAGDRGGAGDAAAGGDRPAEAGSLAGTSRGLAAAAAAATDGPGGVAGSPGGAAGGPGCAAAQPAADRDGCDVVFGPAADGGFYLIGATAEAWARSGVALRAALSSAPMGGPLALAHVAQAARELGLRVFELPLWTDVDEAGDLAILDRLHASPAPAQRLRGEPLRELREVYLHVTERCGRGCAHCYNAAAPQADPELTTAEWRRLIDQCVALGARNFVFIGGDPMLRDDLTELIDYVTGAQGRGARFFFNGSITPQEARRLAEAGHDRLRPLPSVDGMREANDALRGHGNYDEVMQAIGALIATGLEPVANTVLLRPVLPTLPALAHELAAAGVRRLHLILPHQRGSLPAHTELVPTGAEMLAALRELLPAAEKAGIAVDNLSSWRRRLAAPEDLCTAGCRDLAIDPYGRVHACAITCGDPAFVAGDARRQSVETIWRASPALRLLRASRARDRAECAACPVVDACGGECWVQAHYAARARGLPAGYGAAFPYCDLVRPVFEELLAEAADERAGEAADVHGAEAADVHAEAQACGAPPAAAACLAAAGAATVAPAACPSAASGTGGGQAAAVAADYALFDCI